jgi:hypothetical protein
MIGAMLAAAWTSGDLHGHWVATAWTLAVAAFVFGIGASAVGTFAEIKALDE